MRFLNSEVCDWCANVLVDGSREWLSWDELVERVCFDCWEKPAGGFDPLPERITDPDLANLRRHELYEYQFVQLGKIVEMLRKETAEVAKLMDAADDACDYYSPGRLHSHVYLDRVKAYRIYRIRREMWVGSVLDGE